MRTSNLQAGRFKSLLAAGFGLVLLSVFGEAAGEDSQTVIDDYFELKNTIAEKVNLDVGFKYSLMYQQRTGTSLSENNYDLNGQFDFYGSWSLFKDKGTLYWLYMHIHQLGGITTTEFGERNGNFTPINDSDPTSLLRVLMYRHRFFDGALELMGGKFEPLLLFGANRYAADDRVTFMVLPLSAPGAKDRTFSSPGGGVVVAPLDWLSLAATLNSLDFSSGISEDPFGKGEFYSILNATFTPTVSGLGDAVFRISGVLTDAQEATDNNNTDTPESGGIIVSADQDLGDQWAAFLRYDNTDIQTSFSTIRESISGGVVYRGPFRRKRDWLSAGAFHTKSEQQGDEQETGFEVFYRLGWTEYIDLTFNLQGFWPSRADDFFTVAGIRLMVRL
jgi:hypothetical protein